MSIFLNSILESDDLLDTDLDLDNDVDDEPLATDINDGILASEPLEEASMIMYESQANFNQLMMAIGMHELNEAARGKVAVFTEADVSGFFAKVKDTIKRMFERVVTAINEFLIDFSSKVRKDAQFVTQNKDKIIAGHKAGNWSLEGYLYKTDFTDLIKMFEDTSKSHLVSAESLTRDEFKNDSFSAADAEEFKKLKTEMLKTISGSSDSKDYKSISAAVDSAVKKCKGDAVELYGKIDINDVINLLKGNGLTTAKATIRNIRESYKKVLNKLNDMEKTIKKDKNDKNKSSELKAISKISDYIVFERNLCNSVYLASLRILRDKTNQARKIAHKCYNQGKDASAAKLAGIGESSLFNLDLI